MIAKLILGMLCAICASLGIALFQVAGTTAGGGTESRLGDFALSEPQTHDNLTIFLIRGEDRIKSETLLPLEESLFAKKAVVHETGNVNLLEVENTSKDAEVFIQSGDIVKGGKQDRMIAFDLLLPPNSGRISVVAFCVNETRWQQRGIEAVTKFGSSSAQIPSKSLKLIGGQYAQMGGQLGGQGFQFGGQGLQRGDQGLQFGGQGLQSGQSGFQIGQFGGQGLQLGQVGAQLGGQGGVWTEVAAVQRKLRKNSGAKETGSSLQLTLEDKNVQEAVDKYMKKLAPALDGQKDVIGIAFAINGKIDSADVYASSTLFEKMWPKLLKASATEALTEFQKDKKFPKVSAKDVEACMVDAEKGKMTEKDVSKHIRARMRETEKSILLETLDRQRKGTWIHKTYLTK